MLPESLKEFTEDISLLEGRREEDDAQGPLL